MGCCRLVGLERALAFASHFSSSGNVVAAGTWAWYFGSAVSKGTGNSPLSQHYTQKSDRWGSNPRGFLQSNTWWGLKSIPLDHSGTVGHVGIGTRMPTDPLIFRWLCRAHITVWLDPRLSTR